MRKLKTTLVNYLKSLTDNTVFNLGMVLIIFVMISILSVVVRQQDDDISEEYYNYYEETELTSYEEITTYGESTTVEDTTYTTNVSMVDESNTGDDIENCSTITDICDESTHCTTTCCETKENQTQCIENNIKLNNEIVDFAPTMKEEVVEISTTDFESTSCCTTVKESISSTTNEETTTITETTTQETTMVTTTCINTTTTKEETSSENVDNSSLTYLKTFHRGTYYSGQYYSSNPANVKGGSGRVLIDCSIGDGTGIKGSIASNYIQRNYGYNRNGGRTLVYIECVQYPELNGTYYLDDSQGYNNEVIDFFYYYNSNCPFQYQGVVTVEAWLVN